MRLAAYGKQSKLPSGSSPGRNSESIKMADFSKSAYSGTSGQLSSFLNIPKRKSLLDALQSGSRKQKAPIYKFNSAIGSAAKRGPSHDSGDLAEHNKQSGIGATPNFKPSAKGSPEQALAQTMQPSGSWRSPFSAKLTGINEMSTEQTKRTPRGTKTSSFRAEAESRKKQGIKRSRSMNAIKAESKVKAKKRY